MQPDRPPTSHAPKAPLELRSWAKNSLQHLCCILWELQVRSVGLNQCLLLARTICVLTAMKGCLEALLVANSTTASKGSALL